VKRWARRTAELHSGLSAIAKTDLGWWLFAGGAAAIEPWGVDGDYVKSDANPAGDTFIGYRQSTPVDPIADAIARARAARTAIRELEGQLPAQTLAVTIDKGNTTKASPATLVPSELEIAAFAIGDRCAIGRLDDPQLPAQLAAVIAGETPLAWNGPTPFACVSLGEDAIETARHGHRRAWRGGRGPWLGLGRTHELATVSTCHMVVDGYGHSRITGRIAELSRSLVGQQSWQPAGWRRRGSSPRTWVTAAG
jgi:hypothetical protein